MPIARVIYLEPDIYSAAADRAGTGAAAPTAAVPRAAGEPGEATGRPGG